MGEGQRFRKYICKWFYFWCFAGAKRFEQFRIVVLRRIWGCAGVSWDGVGVNPGRFLRSGDGAASRAGAGVMGLGECVGAWG